MNLLRRLALVLAAMLGLALLTPSTAQANTNCNWNLNAGCIQNISGTYSLRVGEDWCGTAADANLCNSSRTTYISRGAWSPYYDTDAFYVPAGYDARTKVCSSYYECGYLVTATGWHKVGNYYNHYVELVRE